jgi:hypothetical protein
MRLVAASRVLNEDDLLEAFVRHHAALVDHHVFLDNGSSDRSLSILRSLQAEGLPLTVLQARAAHFCETPVLTGLFRMAAGLGADWVLMLDCDEFVDQRRAEGGLRAVLAGLPPEQGVLGLPVSAYHPKPDDDATDLLVPRRIRWRDLKHQPDPKIILRGSLAVPNVSVAAGSHGARRDGQIMPVPLAGGVALAHFPCRSPWQQAAKSMIGRLKVIAAGQEMAASNLSHHYNADFDRLRDDPASLLRNGGFLSPGAPSTGLVEDPIDYQGGDLRHTVAGDPMLKAIAGVAAFGEVLASQHARLLDTNEGARLQVHNWSLTWTRLV